MKYQILLFISMIASLFSPTLSQDTCNYAYTALNRTYDANAGACVVNALNVVTSTLPCQCTALCKIQVYMAEAGETCNNGTWTASVQGCTNSAASNYNSDATQDDGSCCTQATVNFSVDAGAVVSAAYDNVVINGNFNNWNEWGVTLSGPDTDGVYEGSLTVNAGSYQYVQALTGSGDEWSGWGVIGNAPAACAVAGSVINGGYYGFTVTCGQVLTLPTVCFASCSPCIVSVSGCTNSAASNYNSAATQDDGSCLATCDSFKCHVAFTLRENPETIDCASTVCDKREDLYTCCEAADALYTRDKTGKNDCHDANCDGDGNKCVDSNEKVETPCICKNTYRVDDIVTEVDDRCEEDGLYSDSSVTDVENFGYVPSYTVTHKNNSPSTIGCAKTCQGLFDGMTTKILRGSSTFGLAICKDHLECSLCPKCIQAAETYDWAFMPPRVQTGNVVGGGCYPWCESNFEGTFDSCTTAAPCGNVKLETVIATEIAAGRLADNQEAKNKYRKSRLCSWNRCGGCKKCLEHADTDDYGGKAALIDEDGSSTTWVGGCSWWCSKNFDAVDVDSIPNANLKTKTNAYVGTLLEKLEFARSVVSGWKRCSGCKKIKEWANEPTADWRSKRALVDYSGQENTRRKSDRMGKCNANTCKEDFEAAATDEEKEEICASYNCNGCGKCEKWVTELSNRGLSDTFGERVSKSAAKTIDSMKVAGTFATVGTASGSRRKGGCAGYPICRERLQGTVCKKLYCEGCDFCA